MIPDLAFVNDSFERFNAMIFGNRLPVPVFTLTRARTFRGKLVYTLSRTLTGRKNDRFEMRISTGFDLPKEEWEDVVVHEMIHLHIASERVRDTSAHGPAFRRIMAEINMRHGRHITVSARSAPEQTEADLRVRAHYICLARMRDGRLAVAPVAKTRIFSLWDAFGRCPDIVSAKWVGVLDPWFNRFPRVMVPKVYFADEGEVALHLKGAVPLEREGGTVRAVSRRCSPDELLPKDR